MIGNCDCCDRQDVPIRHFEAGETNAGCETTACFICQGDNEVDPYGEMDSRDVPGTEEVSKKGQAFSESGTEPRLTANMLCTCRDQHRRGYCQEPDCPNNMFATLSVTPQNGSTP